MANLVSTILGAVPPAALERLAGQFGETPEATGRALSGVVPALAGAIAMRARHGGISDVMAMMDRTLDEGNPLDDPALWDDMRELPADNGMIAQMLGPQMGPMAAALAGALGVKGSTINGLMVIALPLVLGGIARMLGDQPTAEGMLNLLQNERQALASAMPAGVAPLLAGFAAEPTPLHGTAVEGAGAAAGMMSKWLPWVLAAIVALGVIFGLRNCTSQPTTETAQTEAMVTEMPAARPAPPESRVVSSTRDGRPALEVHFASADSGLPPELASAAQPIRDYLNANPEARLSVSGSPERAEQVAGILGENAIDRGRIMVDKQSGTGGSQNGLAASRVDVTIRP